MASAEFGKSNELDPAVESTPLSRVVAGDRPLFPGAGRGQPLLVDAAFNQPRLDGVGAVERQGLVVLRISRGVGMANDPQMPIGEVLERRRNVVQERLRVSRDCRLVTGEAQAIEIVVLLRLQRLLHGFDFVLLG